MRSDTLIHLELANGQHHYFGSLTAIFTHFTPEQIGVDLQILYRLNIDPDHPYMSSMCTIRKGKLHRKPTNRKPPIKIIRVMG